MKQLLVTLALCNLAGLASAQTVWRCGPDGRSFSDTPCAEGRALAVAETRPAEDLAAARARAEHEIRLAEQLRRERLAEEAAQRGSGLASLGPVAADTKRPPLRQATGFKRPSKEAQLRPQALRPAGPAARGTSRAVAPSSRQKTD
ncbi:DUF4124 domain-containing protein [Rubrivivax rivuli]|uniref:DUF4124 domain-containing protein n=1 Tax=Rubrivivax rivuli TaxID=1862385 RepID=UPI00267BAA4C